MNSNNIRKIAIVGGGTAGWMSAAALSHATRGKTCEIALIESADIGIVGVGEATIPPIINFIKHLGIDETEFIQATQGSIKLGIKFQDWYRQDHSFWHPFGDIGVTIDDKLFFPYWLKARQLGDTTPYTAYSPAAVMGDANRFYPPYKAAKDSFLAAASYAYHFDAALVARFMRRYAEARGVKRIEDNVIDVALRENGFIDKLTLEKHPAVEADLYLDCTGFRALLIGKILQVPYDDWIDYLPCDRAVAMPTANTGQLPPYTLSTAKNAGWVWRIPLQHRTGNGYVYCSRYCDDDEAVKTLHASVQGEPLAEPRLLRFTTGRRKEMWNKNCVAIGLSAGFLEPLESTAIQLILKGVRSLIELFPDKAFEAPLVREYNRLMNRDYENIRDFIVLHYCTTQRDDTAFWRWCREQMRIPESLQEKIDLFKSRGCLQWNPTDLFREPSWYSVFLGMGIEPRVYDPLIDSSDFSKVETVLKQVRTLMVQMADGLPLHAEYLRKHCPAPADPVVTAPWSKSSRQGG